MSRTRVSRYDGLSYRCLSWAWERLQNVQTSFCVMLAHDVVGSELPRPPSEPHQNSLSNCHCTHTCTLSPSTESALAALRQEVTALTTLREEVCALKEQVASLYADRKGPITLPLPPLPPPPPPPLPPSAPQTSAHLENATAKSQQQAANSRKLEEAKQRLALLEALKDIGKVKLKQIEKSPSGTPLKRQAPARAPPPSDPNARLAAALQARFSSIHPGDSSDESSQEPWSPASPRTRVQVYSKRRLLPRKNSNGFPANLRPPPQKISA